MKRWVFGSVLLVATFASPVSAQNSCPPARPFRLLPSLTPVLGKSPLWVTTGGPTIAWEGANTPVQALWIRDLAVRGPAVLGGKLMGGKAPAKFARATLGMPEERYKFDLLGDKPSTVKQADLEKYSFHRTFIWFPEAGCYEMTARIGSQQAVIYLNVAPSAGKAQQTARGAAPD